MAENNRVFCSYKSLFSIKYRIYNVGEVSLPRPLPLDALGVFAALLVPCLSLGRLLGPLFHLSPAAAGLLLDVAVTWACYQFDPQGRSLPAFLADLLAFAVRPRRVTFGGESLRTVKERARWEALELEGGVPT